MTEEDKYILRVEGEENLRKLIAAQEKEEQQLQKTLEAQKRAAAAYGAASAQAQQFATQVQASATSLVANEAAIRNQSKALDGLGGKMTGLNGTIRNVGYGVSDVFSNNGPLGQKMQGFSNNVSNITTGILSMAGKTGPWALAFAGGLEIAFTAAGAAMTAFGVKSLEDLKNVFTGGTKEVENTLKGLETRIEDLTKKPHLIPVEQVELENALNLVGKIKAALAEVKAIGASQGGAEDKSGKGVKTAFAEATDDQGNRIGAQGAYGKMRAAVVRELVAQADAAGETEQAPIRAEIERLRKSAPLPGEHGEQIKADRLAEQQELLDAAVARHTSNRTRAGTAPDDKTPADADKYLAGMKHTAEQGAGKDQQSAQAELIRRSRAAGLNTLAEELEKSTPAAAAAQIAGKKVEEKLQKLRDMLHASGETEEQVNAAVASVAGLNANQLDKVIHDTGVSLADDKREKAAKAKAATAARKADNELVSDLNAQGKEREKGTLDEINAGRAREGKKPLGSMAALAREMRGDGTAAAAKSAQTAAEKKAKEAMPDLDKAVDHARMTEIAGGGKADKDAMARQLMVKSGSTMSLAEARSAIDDSFGESDGRLRAHADRLTRGEGGGGYGGGATSTTYDAANLARQIQGGVGGDTDKAMLAELKTNNGLLQTLVDKKIIAAGAKR